MVAGAADEVVQASAFAAQDEDAIAGEVEVVVVGVRDAVIAGVETDDPEVVAFQLLEGTDKIDDAGDAQVFGGAGAGFDGHRAEGRGPAFGENDAVDTGSVGNAQQCTEVLRIFDAIESEDKATRAGMRGVGGKQVFDGEKLMGADKSDNALMRGRFGEEGELFAGLGTDADAGFTAEGEDTIETGVVAFASHEDVVETSAAGFERLLNGVHSVQNFHEG